MFGGSILLNAICMHGERSGLLVPLPGGIWLHTVGSKTWDLAQTNNSFSNNCPTEHFYVLDVHLEHIFIYIIFSISLT